MKTKTPIKKLSPKAALKRTKKLAESIRDEAMWELVEGGVSRNYARSESPTEWIMTSSAQKGYMGLEQQEMIAAARSYFRNDPNARAALMGMMKYIMGRGVGITPKSSDPRIWYQWREFWTSPRNKMKIRQFEIVKRLFRDGEVFLRYFTKRNGQPTTKVTVRFIDPIDVQHSSDQDGVKNTTDVMHQGIEFDPNDPETPVKYWVRKPNAQDEYDEIPAAEVQHIKLFADMDQSRSESFLVPVMHLFGKYKTWLEDRMILNKLRTAVVMIREIEGGTASDITTLRDATSNSSNGGKKGIKSGTIYTAGPGVKLRMDSANINASDVKEDGRNIILQMAAGTGMPEYLYGDASNSNFASSLIAESPFVKEIQFWQSFLEAGWIEEMFRRVIRASVDSGKIAEPVDEDVFEKFKNFDPASVALSEAATEADAPDAGQDQETDPTKQDQTGSEKNPYGETATEIFYGCDTQWPEIVHRDTKDQTEALVLQRDQGWISDKTASEVLGYDYSEEVRKQKRLEAEGQKNGNPLMGVQPGQTAADAQDNQAMQDMMSSLTPEERKAVLGGDTASVAAMMKAKMNGAAA